MSIAAVPNQPVSYLGRVRQGVIVPDGPLPWSEGTPVRFEVAMPAQPEPSLAEKLKAFDAMVKKWDEEDAQVSDEDVKKFQQELRAERGLHFHDDAGLDAMLLDDQLMK